MRKFSYLILVLWTLSFTTAECRTLLTSFDNIHRVVQQAGLPSAYPHSEYAPRYTKSPYVPDEIWDALSPYFLPENHPIKKKLDKIFKKRVTKNRKSLKKAGFSNTKPGKFSMMTVVSHPMLKNYLLKLYRDDQPNIDDWARCRDRVIGALETKKAIISHGYEDLFIVPKKWIYPLPAHPSPPGSDRRNFILVVEKIDIENEKQNKVKWKTIVTPQMLDAVFTILAEVGLWDSALAFNIPFTRDGKKIAFIDTEFYHRWPVPFKRLRRYLAPGNQIYWDQLIENYERQKERQN